MKILATVKNKTPTTYLKLLDVPFGAGIIRFSGIEKHPSISLTDFSTI